MRHVAVRSTALLALVFLLAGCGGETGSAVTGTVTYDGQPVKNGSITFVRTDGAAREGAVIRDGAFATRMPPGKYKIELSGQKPAGKRTQKGFDGKDEVIELTEELFPEKYNAKTELAEEIKPGPNTVTLDLKK